MFSNNNKSEKNLASAGTGTTIISAGTTVKGNINSDGDFRIDGTIEGNVTSNAKIVIGSSGIVQGDLLGYQADIVGKVTGNVRVKELLQLRGEAVVNGNLFAGKLQVEPSATFNGQCHMGGNIVEMSNNNDQKTSIQQ